MALYGGFNCRNNYAIAWPYKGLLLPASIINKKYVALKLAPESTGAAGEIPKIGRFKWPSLPFLRRTHEDVAHGQVYPLQKSARANQEVNVTARYRFLDCPA